MEEKDLNRLTSLSVFFPAYNEEANVERMVETFNRVLPRVADDYEIIILNDGSKDRTREIADCLIKENRRVRAVHHEKIKAMGQQFEAESRPAPKSTSFSRMETVSSMFPSLPI
jgi:cellulose synthase/poly-beta-1,6-N-acetylglucosamine synthase-like glycosyltransferase